MLVRFACECDKCSKRSDEWTIWPSCTVCQEEICPDCQEPGTLREPDEGDWGKCVCKPCAADQRNDDPGFVGVEQCSVCGGEIEHYQREDGSDLFYPPGNTHVWTDKGWTIMHRDCVKGDQ